MENGGLTTSLLVSFQQILIQSSSSDEEMSAVTLPHVGSLPRHEQRTQHNMPALVQEQLLKHLDFLHLHETGCWMFALAGIVINDGHNLPLIRTRPNSVAGGRAGLLRCAVLYKASW